MTRLMCMPQQTAALAAHPGWATADLGSVRTVQRRGEFYNQDLIEGRATLVRYVWSEITDGSCRWEQAFSWDSGATWTVDWIMEFERA